MGMFIVTRYRVIYDDFWIKGPKDLGIPGYFELCGIESPGLTAAPAISKFLVSKIMDECLRV